MNKKKERWGVSSHLSSIIDIETDIGLFPVCIASVHTESVMILDVYTAHTIHVSVRQRFIT